ncbi:hypothetical protein ITG08_16105 [Vibrio cyclitrophicus]|nr:hypothetical protein [Vibrio cyclitrophicus]MBY7659238.1 hypothetical protein [Vibrio atlanticus]UPR27576.1 hypothetical protein ITG08_16105 [Vibrio cyclitrophicus]|tara:strand:- start:5968 stop:6141 length:174 start_codon:yes stop_codon:yes gene_type:complete
MTIICNKAMKEQRNQVTLSSFRSSTLAISFYQALGYQVIDDSYDYFMGLVLHLNREP